MVRLVNNFNLVIDRNEVLRYLGYKHQKIDERTEKLIDECIEEMKSIAKPRFIYNFFELNKKEGAVELKNSSLVLTGKDIYNHLKDSVSSIVMAVTLGSEVDRRIRYYEKVDLARALVLDACSTQAVEEVCDILEANLRKEVQSKGKNLNWRYSPGYGDLPIEVQGQLISTLNCNAAIGLTVTNDNIMLPRKSVTAIMGIVEGEVAKKRQTCAVCSKFKDCNFRRVGGSCGH